MLTKESKIRVLENFYALDYTFFGKQLKKVETSSCCAVKEEYLSIKGALMSVVVEMLKLVDHKPGKLTEQLSTKDLLKNARESARIVRENAKKIVTSQKSRDSIKTELIEIIQSDKEIDITSKVEEKIREKAFCLAVDNLLVARMVKESENYKNLNDWTGRILEDSYKVLRDSLVESANNILDDAESK